MNVINGTFADNPTAIDIDRSEEIGVLNTKITGRTTIQQELEQRQNVPSVCDENSLVGIEMHTYVRKAENNGAYIDVDFSGFDASMCDKVSHFALDNELGLGTFDWFTTLERVSFANQPVLVDFCSANTAGIVDAYLTDLDGSAKPLGHTAGPGSIVSSSPIMTAFVDPLKCTENSEGCYTYCSHCFRSVRFDVDPTGTEGLFLVVESKTTGEKIWVEGYLDLEKKGSSIANTRVFYAHLPNDEYEASFSVWPTFVKQTYEDKLCPESFDDDAVRLLIPSPETGECTNLIRNGDAEDPNEAFWLSRFTGITSQAGSGLKGSNALRDVDIVSERDAIVQFLDTRCFSTNEQVVYEITAWIKLVNQSNEPVACDPKSGMCPEIQISSPSATWTKVATLVPQMEESDFQLLHGVFHVPQALRNPEKLDFVLVRNQAENLNLEVDNVSMVSLSTKDVFNKCQSDNLVYNGDFAMGDAKFWSQSTASMDLSGSSNGYNLHLSNGYARVFLNRECLQEGRAYEISITYRILDSSGKEIDCDSNVESGNGLCPSSTVLFFEDGSFKSQFRVARDFNSINGGWRSLQGIFPVSFGMLEGTDMAVIQIEDLDPKNTYVIDSVSFTARDQLCNDSITANSDMSLGIESYWTGIDSDVVGITKGFNDEYALKSFARTLSIQGPKYNSAFFLDETCLLPGARLEIQGKVQLRVAGTDTRASCEVGSEKANEDACPGEFIQNQRKATLRLVSRETLSSQLFFCNSISIQTPGLVEVDDVHSRCALL